MHAGTIIIQIALIIIKDTVKSCPLLSRKPKKLDYADKIKKSLNKNKTIWDTVNWETNKTVNTEKINTLNIDGISISDRQEIANGFNKYFLTIAKSINTKPNELGSHNVDNTTT